MRIVKIMLLVMLLCLTAAFASAEKTKYFNGRYNFQGLSNIELTQVMLEADPRLTTDNYAVERFRDCFEKMLNDKKIPYTISSNQGYLIYPSSLRGAALPLAITIHSYGYRIVEHPGYYSTYTDYVDEYYYRHDQYGREIRETRRRPVTRTRWNPPYSEKVYDTNFEFVLRDASGSEVLFSIRDERTRAISEPSGMLERTVKDFIKVLRKLHEDGKAD